MDFSSSFKKSFKSHGSYKHTRRISAGSISNDTHIEQKQPILSDHHRHHYSDEVVPNRREMQSAVDAGDRREVIVKIDAGEQNGGIWRDSSYDFWKDGERGRGGFDFQAGTRETTTTTEDPPSKLIAEFLSKQRASGGEMPLDMDLEMDELRRDYVHPRNSNVRNISPIAETDDGTASNTNDTHRISTSKELKVSFQSNPLKSADRYDSSGDEVSANEIRPQQPHYHNRRRSSNVSYRDDGSGGGEVLKCTSSQRRMSILRTKTKSRLLDPEMPEKKSGKVAKSGPIKSGMLGKPAGDEEEEDPWSDEDLPDDFKKGDLSPLTIGQWLSLVLIVTALICTLTIPKWKRRQFRGLELWKWEVLILVLICGRLVSGWGIRIIVFFIERNFLLRKRVLYFVYGVRKPVQNCIWLGLVLLAWHYMFDKEVDRHNQFLKFVNKIMLCLLLATLLWLVKTLMVKVLASSFHVSTFFDRIQDSLFNQYVIETLSGQPLLEIQSLQDEEERTMAEINKLQNAGARIPADLKSTTGVRGVSFRYSGTFSKKQDDGITIDHLHRLNPKNVSAWNMKRLMNIVRHGSLSTLDEQILDTTTEDESTTQIRSEFEAKVAARKIFRNVARPGAKFIYLDDLMRFLQEDEALKALNLIEGSSESEKIGKSALKNWVVDSFRERRALALTLNDTKTAVNKLHQMVNVLVGVLILLMCLVILGIASSKFLLFLSSQVVVVAFIFGNTCKTVFEAIIFLFVMHPYDVGDRCEIDGVQMVVEEMNILTTVFLRYDNQKIIYPNSTLSTKSISNYYRSPDMGDSVDFFVHIATPADKIALMKQRIISFLENKKDYWYSSPSVVLMNLEGLNAVKMSVWMRHRMNHQNMGEKWLRRALVIEEMVKIFKELDIQYRLYPLDINIRAMPPH